MQISDQYEKHGYIELSFENGILDLWIGGFFLKVMNVDFFGIIVSDFSVSFNF